MAPFRASRSARNNDPATLNRGRGGVIDHDPTEGLPVRNWYLGNVNIKQDEPVIVDDDQQPSANTINPDYPWQELRLPSFYQELPPLSQQFVRIGRSGRPVKPSVYDKKTGTYISHAEYATRNTLKSKHLENVDSPAAEEDDEMEDDLDGKGEMEKQERMFALRKWAQVPPAIADKRPEPKYLADRLPGMRSLYGIQAGVLNPALNTNTTTIATASFDLGEGSGLGNATGVLAAGTEIPAAAATPVKRMPPKRKKKGGPGRKKAKLGATDPSANGIVGAESALIGGAQVDGEAGDPHDTNGEGDTHMEDGHDGEEGSESEEEGSEEGEIEEHHPPDAEMKTEDIAVIPAPEILPLEEVPAIATIVEEAITAEVVEPIAASQPAEISEPTTILEPVEILEPIDPPIIPTPILPSDPIIPATIEVVELVEAAPVPASASVPVTEVLAEEPIPVLEPIPEAPEVEVSETKVELLQSIDDAVTDQEKKEDVTPAE